MKNLALFAVAGLAAAALGGDLVVGCPTANLDEFRQVAEFAKAIGATHVDACQIEHSLWQWNQNRYDPYPNWSMHRPSIFKFIVPEELKKYIPADYAARNLATLKARGEILKALGLKSNFAGMEPAYFPEQAYLDHPNWRGARCDQARRARGEYYAPCTDDPEVRAMYVKTVAELCKVCPFEFFKFRSNDSGAGFCWVKCLYAGANGPDRCAEGAMGPRVADFMSAVQEGARLAGLKNPRVNIRADFAEDEANVILALKPGQSLNNKTKEGASATEVIGFPNRFTDYCAPIYALTRLPRLAGQLQKAQMHPDHDCEIGFRSPNELDLQILLRKYLKKPMGVGPAARLTAISDVAAAIVGEANAPALVAAWEALDEANKRLDPFYTGGHLFLLGSLHQRWITRPFVAFPNELQGEDRRYWREFIFQAQTEADADNMLDLQANRWLNGNGGQKLTSMLFTHGVLASIKSSAVKFAELQGKGVDAAANRWLADQAAKTAFYVCLVKNANNAINFQSILDRTDYDEAPEDTTWDIREQGDVRLHKLNLIVRAEIDNVHEMIRIVERAADPVVDHAASDAEQTIMRFGPKASFLRDLRRKVAIMEAHRRDFLRLYKSYNR